MTFTEQKGKLLADFAVSFWLRDAIRALDGRDPVDALKDADTLHTLQTVRLEELLSDSLRLGSSDERGRGL